MRLKSAAGFPTSSSALKFKADDMVHTRASRLIIIIIGAHIFVVVFATLQQQLLIWYIIVVFFYYYIIIGLYTNTHNTYED